MKISLFQYSPEWENKVANMEKISQILSAKRDFGELIIFPEMTLTGFTMNAKRMAENSSGESIEFFTKIAVKNKANVFCGIIEKSGKSFYNSLFHINKAGKVIAKYRKIHPFSYSTEDKFYKPGRNIVTSNVNDFKIGLSICYDLRFPELYRFYAKENVDLIINIANWPVTRIEHWRTLLKARAIENQCYVAGVNRVGDDLKLKYNGYSSVFDPMGKEIFAERDIESVLTTDIDLKYLKTVRKKLPFLPDMKMI
jgi:predicted amidohydrolase